MNLNENKIIIENIKRFRKLQLEAEQTKNTITDQKNEEEKFKKQFDDLSVFIKFIDLEVYDDLVFWGGNIDGVIDFVYKITPNSTTSGIEYNYGEDFNPDNKKNDEIIKRIDSYYNIFYKYWKDSLIEK